MLNATLKMNRASCIRAVSFLVRYISDMSANPLNMVPVKKREWRLTSARAEIRLLIEKDIPILNAETAGEII